eukprot:GDKJ01032160.1.p1 GENE.GDKJ01032160.1~~GDKJ01032160.1.p1  ORF type:complete len:479 (-),score=89.60 GDKJ01032160.1:57-1493(-)
MQGRAVFSAAFSSNAFSKSFLPLTASALCSTSSDFKFSNVYAHSPKFSTNLNFYQSNFRNAFYNNSFKSNTYLDASNTSKWSRFMNLSFLTSPRISAACEAPADHQALKSSSSSPPPECPYHKVVNSINGVTDLPAQLSLPSSNAVVYGYETRRSLWSRIAGALATILFVAIWVFGSLVPLSIPYFLFTSQFKFASYMTGAVLVPHILSALGWLRKGPLAKALRSLSLAATEWLPAGTCVVVENPEAIRNSKKPLMYAIHPHGVFSTSLMVLVNYYPDFHNTKMIMAPFMHYAHPIFKLLTQPLMKSASSSKKDLQKVMRNKENLAIVPGGFQEASLTQRGTDRLYFHKRSGYLYYAIKYGYDIVPVYMFGENDLFHTIGGGYNLRFWLNHLHIPTVLFAGWGGTFLPIPTRVMVVVGSPVSLPENNEIKDRELVKNVQYQYFNALNKLFDTYKFVYFNQMLGKDCKVNPRSRHLELW